MARAFFCASIAVGLPIPPFKAQLERTKRFNDAQRELAKESVLEVVLSQGRVVRVPAGFDPATLRQLLGLLSLSLPVRANRSPVLLGILMAWKGGSAVHSGQAVSQGASMTPIRLQVQAGTPSIGLVFRQLVEGEEEAGLTDALVRATVSLAFQTVKARGGNSHFSRGAAWLVRQTLREWEGGGQEP